ncbi:hypothetical protein GGTG_12287 [Gaeumannomyces tritici R3-111a-1]|uniref:Uncharacterized protein n=1 Tax=Gaeumannomyces tritici (strain R3-111a-1) TaxID=644352 RepID=J3PFL2_GAET3|nr:hypothetical protein GGTG_12287 [Gaeumannomyces tritici R3-111a-1]EJT70114.1 hypothetical protein GGTG_12287 [Gaeumannomyces tritici R3-111a-1]
MGADLSQSNPSAQLCVVRAAHKPSLFAFAPAASTLARPAGPQTPVLSSCILLAVHCSLATADATATGREGARASALGA